MIGLNMTNLFEKGNFESVSDHFQTSGIIELTPTVFTYLNSSEFLMHISLIKSKKVLKKFNVTDDFISPGYLLISFRYYHSLKYLAFINQLFLFKFVEYFSFCYAMHTMFFFLLRMISSCSLMKLLILLF